MGRTSVAILIFTALWTFVIAVPEDEVNNAKFVILIKELPLTANAIRNMTIRNSDGKMELARMTSDFIAGFDLVVNNLNCVIPNVVGTDGFNLLKSLAIYLKNITQVLEKMLTADPEALKKELAAILDEGKKEAEDFVKNYKEPNEFVHNQMKRKHDLLIFAILKIKYEALLFEKTNEEVVNVINERVGELENAIKTLSSTDKTTEIEMRHALHHLSTILERNIYRLENWFEVNPSRVDDILVIQEVTNVFSDLFKKLIQAANTKNKTPQLQTQLLQAIPVIAKNAEKIGRIKDSDNLGGREFIRSSLFDFVTFGKTYTDNIKTVLS